MYSFSRYAAYLIAAIILCGCPIKKGDVKRFSSYDPTVKDLPGTITLSDPKLYTREALISERARDLKWINQLIADSESNTKVVFRPEVIREIEQISSMAGAIGLKFDPAAALAYRRADDKNDIQNDIDSLKLQLQLDQLKRDAEILRSKLGIQTEMINPELGKLGANSIEVIPNISTSAVDQLKIAVEKLDSTLKSRLDLEQKPLISSNVPASPFDDFRDRSAYRDMLKAAQNAAGLDELHDYASARLIRLNFQATAIPQEGNLQSLGAIQMRISEPNQFSQQSYMFLKSWLEYINTYKDFRSGTKLNRKNAIIREFLINSAFETVAVKGVEILLPVFENKQEIQSPSKIYKASNWYTANPSDHSDYEKEFERSFYVAGKDQQLTSSYDLLFFKVLDICNEKPKDINDPDLAKIKEAISREQSIGYLLLADAVVQSVRDQMLALHQYSELSDLPEILTEDISEKINDARKLNRKMFESFETKSLCTIFASNIKQPISEYQWSILGNVRRLGIDKPRFYEIGPREQVQQVSNSSRSANSLALAAALAAAAPGSGVGADAAASYSRQVMGRASTIERIPSVVGYTHASDGSFGWVIGPRTVLNESGGVDVTQLLKTYDLSIDMSVPGWWPSLDLEVTTAWAPSPKLLSEGKLLQGNKQDLSKKITVPLVRNSVDEFDAFSQYVLGARYRSVKIETLKGGPINPCEPSNLLITGENIWRAKQVFVLGQLILEKDISVTADMKGILVSVPAIKPPPDGSDFAETMIQVITSVGTSSPFAVDYVSKPTGDDCKPKKAQTVEEVKDVISVTDVQPQEFVVPSNLFVVITGVNLDKIVKVTLGTQPGVIQPTSTNDKTLTVFFSKDALSSVTASDKAQLIFYKNPKSGTTLEMVGSKPVRTVKK